MKRVSMVFTEHAENGLCNSSELLALLERINPEVIFIEAPATALDVYLNDPRHNLESNAIKRYLEQHRAELVPVDLPTPDAAFFAKFRELIESIPSREYDQLATWHRDHVRAHGLGYLNSETCGDLFAKQHEAILTGIGRLADRQRLTEDYDSWLETIKRRDIAMVENIEKHCQQASFSNSAFLVGAAHRRSIMSLSRRETEPGASTIQWDFSGSGELR